MLRIHVVEESWKMGVSLSSVGSRRASGERANNATSVSRCQCLRCDFEKLYSSTLYQRSTSVASVLRHIRLVSKCLYTGPTEVRVTARGGVKSRIPKSSELSYDA